MLTWSIWRSCGEKGVLNAFQGSMLGNCWPKSKPVDVMLPPPEVYVRCLNSLLPDQEAKLPFHDELCLLPSSSTTAQHRGPYSVSMTCLQLDGGQHQPFLLCMYSNLRKLSPMGYGVSKRFRSDTKWDTGRCKRLPTAWEHLPALRLV